MFIGLNRTLEKPAMKPRSDFQLSNQEVAAATHEDKGLGGGTSSPQISCPYIRENQAIVRDQV